MMKLYDLWGTPIYSCSQRVRFPIPAIKYFWWKNTHVYLKHTYENLQYNC